MQVVNYVTLQSFTHKSASNSHARTSRHTELSRNFHLPIQRNIRDVGASNRSTFGLLLVHHRLNAVFCKTVSLPQFCLPHQPSHHTFVSLSYNRQKKARLSETPHSYPTLAQPLQTAWCTLGLRLEHHQAIQCAGRFGRICSTPLYQKLEINSEFPYWRIQKHRPDRPQLTAIGGILSNRLQNVHPNHPATSRWLVL